jgi:hypothetical protein
MTGAYRPDVRDLDDIIARVEQALGWLRLTREESRKIVRQRVIVGWRVVRCSDDWRLVPMGMRGTRFVHERHDAVEAIRAYRGVMRARFGRLAPGDDVRLVRVMGWRTIGGAP